MKYIVEITETLQKQITVNADTPEKAEEIAQDVYNSGDEVLTAEDLKELEIDVLYDLYGYHYNIFQLRDYYRFITGLDNDAEFTDNELYQYLLDALKEKKDDIK